MSLNENDLDLIASLDEERRIRQAGEDQIHAYRQRANEEARQRYQAQLKAEADARDARRQQEIDQELESEKRRRKVDFMTNGGDPSVFERSVWPELRRELVATRHERLVEKTAAQLRATGEYSL